MTETDLEDPEKQRLQRRLVKEGVERELASAGARRGDEVMIGDVAFEYLPKGSSMGRREDSCEPKPKAGRRSSRSRTVPPDLIELSGLNAEGWAVRD